MQGDFRFETFVEAQGMALQEYFSAVVAKLAKEDEEYRGIREKIENLYEQYPTVRDVVCSERAVALSEQECAALTEVLGLLFRLAELEQQSLYFRGCYDSVGYLKKAGVL